MSADDFDVGDIPLLVHDYFQNNRALNAIMPRFMRILRRHFLHTQCLLDALRDTDPFGRWRLWITGIDGIDDSARLTGRNATGNAPDRPLRRRIASQGESNFGLGFHDYWIAVQLKRLELPLLDGVKRRRCQHRMSAEKLNAFYISGLAYNNLRNNRPLDSRLAC